MRKSSIMLLIFLFIIGFVYWLVAYKIAPYGIITPYRGVSESTPDDYQLSYELLDIKTFDSLTLKGYWVKSNIDTPKATIILLHGVGDLKESFLSTASMLAKQGYESIFYDSRAHGKSEGKYCTFGFHEKRDVAKVVDLIKTESLNRKVGIWGKSMGGAVSLQAMENDDRINFAIIESAFTDLRTIVHDYQKRIMGLRMYWLADIALNKAAKIANFKPGSVKPIESIKKVNRPILLIHGDEDPKIAMKYSQHLLDAASTPNKKLLIISGANHDNVWQIGGDRYRKEIKSFIEKWCNESNFTNKKLLLD